MVSRVPWVRRAELLHSDAAPNMSAAQHDQLVSGLDWCHAHNKIVTCSHDRNAFVFTLDESTDKWTAGLVLLRLTRGCTGAWWSPDGAHAVC